VDNVDKWGRDIRTPESGGLEMGSLARARARVRARAAARARESSVIRPTRDLINLPISGKKRVNTFALGRPQNGGLKGGVWMGLAGYLFFDQNH